MAAASELTLRKIVEASLDAMIIKRVRDDPYIDVNEEFVRMTGRTRAELLGKPAHNLGIWNDPELYRNFYNEVKLRGEMRNCEAAIRTADGKIVEGLVSARVVELNDEQCVIASTHDITERKTLMKELVAAREAALAASRANRVSGDGRSATAAHECCGEKRKDNRGEIFRYFSGPAQSHVWLDTFLTLAPPKVHI